MKQAVLRILAVAAAAFGVAAALAVPALLLNWYEDTLGSSAQLVPWAWELRAVLGYLPIGAAGIVGTWLFTKGRLLLASPSRVRHFAKLVLLLAWTFAAAAAGMVAILFTSDDFIFPTAQPSTSVTSPDGKRTAHVIYDCFLGCTLAYAIEEKGAWSMARVPVMGFMKRAAPLPDIEWVGEGKLKFVGGSEEFASLADRTFPEK